MTRRILTAATVALLALTASAAPRTKQQMREAAGLALAQNSRGQHMAPRKGELKELKNTDAYAIMAYDKNEGFAIVTTDDLAPAVIGVSDHPYSEGRNPHLAWYLAMAEEAINSARTTGVPLTTTLPDPDKYPTSVGPLLTTLWDQDDPYNRMLPYKGNSQVITGCVATAMAQVLNYFETPEHGQGSFYNTTSGTRIDVDFSQSHYDWGHMLDAYNYGQYTEQEANAVALLMRDCGVAAKMEYGTAAEGGSGAYSQDAAEGLRNYFGFEEARCLERDYYSEAEWMDIVYENLSKYGPIYYGGADLRPMYWGGHAFVLDGYREDGKVSVNWGWSGDDNGFFDIAILNPYPYRFDHQQDMIIGVYGETNHTDERPAIVRTLQVETPGTLATLLNPDSLLRYGELHISGPLNGDDLSTLRHMAGINAQGRETKGRLSTLDLTKATINGTNALPAKAFYGAKLMRRLMLPTNIATLGKQSLAGMENLRNLRFNGQTIPTTVSTTFDDTPIASCILSVPSGMSDTYKRKTQWSKFANVIEYGTTVKAQNQIKYYGDDNPERWLYTVTGDIIYGQPELSCDATATSPVGRYDIKVDLGSIHAQDLANVVLRDGYLLVEKAPLTIKADTLTRAVGEENPPLTLTYIGLKNGEQPDETVFTQKPVATCLADSLSPAGDYPIVVSQAVAPNYNVNYVAGVLRVQESSAISDVKAHNATSGRTYDLQGRGVNLHSSTSDLQQKKGIYIRDGRKFVVK